MRARLLPFLVLALLTVFALPLGGVARADVVSGSEFATNPLILKNSVTGAQVQIMPNAGHAPFWDAAGAFNQQLRAFCGSVSEPITVG